MLKLCCILKINLLSKGGNEDPFYNEVINAWQAANIVPVFGKFDLPVD